MSGTSNFLLGFVGGLWIIGGLASIRRPASHPPAAEQDQWVVQGSYVPGPALETEDEFERARR
jgi:hypothetical protein